MKRQFALVLLSIQLLIAASLAVAKEKKPTGPNYIAPSAVDYLKVLSEPPAPDSAEAKADLETVLKLQASRTDAEVKRCQGEAHVSVFPFYSSVLGEWFKADDLPATSAFFTKVAQDSSVIVTGAKEHWKRPRPPSTDPRVHSIFTEKGFSYPSGHSTAATVFGVVLCEIFPEKKAELMARSEETGWDRAIAGIHFPSDVLAGRLLGKAVAAALLADKKFQADLAKVKEELRRAAAAHGESRRDGESPVGCRHRLL